MTKKINQDELIERKTLDLLLRNIGNSHTPCEELKLVEYFIKQGEEKGYDLRIYRAYVKELKNGCKQN